MKVSLSTSIAAATASIMGLIGPAGTATADGTWEYVREFGNSAQDIAVDSNHTVYVLSSSYARVQVFTPEGQFLREQTGFDDPKGIAIDENDEIFVLNRRCRVIRYDLDFQPIAGWDHCLGQGDLLFGRGIDVRDGIVYIASAGGILKFDTDGTPLAHILDHTSWRSVSALADGSVWCVTGFGEIGLVRHYSPSGEVLAEWNTILPGEESSSPTGIAIDSSDRIYIPDVNSVGRVKIFRPDGSLDDLIQVQMRLMVSIELDGDDILYVGVGFPDGVMKFRYVPLAVDPATWGGIKALHR